MKDLTKYNYDDLVAKATELLKDKEGWGDAYQSSTGQMLIQLLADTTDNLHYLLERRSIEGFLHHARLENSVISRASELGYRPLRATAHTGTLELKIKDQNGNFSPPIFEIFIPKYTPFQYEDRVFHNTSPVMMNNAMTSVEIPVREGKVVEKTFAVTDLTEMNEIVLPEWKMVDETSLVVKVGNDEWHDVRLLDDVNKRALSYAGTEDRLYDLKYTTDGMFIVFGDDWFGKKPDNDITIMYIEVTDTEPVYRKNLEFSVAGGIKDQQDPTIYYDVLIENTTIITGGTGIESVESIQKNATVYNQTNGRGVTNTDYAFWAKRAGVGNLVDVSAYGEEEIDSYIHNANNVFISYARPDHSHITATERAELRAYLDNIKTTQAHLVIGRANPVELMVNAKVRKDKTVQVSDAHAYFLIRNFINEMFRVKAGSVGRFFHKSDIINDFYGIRLDDNGVKKQLVDFVKLDINLGVKFNFPSLVRSAIVGIKASEFEDLTLGKEWVIIIDDIVCKVPVTDVNNPSTLLLRMRDTIRALTDVDAKIFIEGGDVDEDGNLIPIEVEPDIGYHLLIGKESSNRGITEVIQPIPIGRTIAIPKLTSENFSITHYYYNPRAGFRPTVPMRDATTITYTPIDTDIEVWVKDSYSSDSDFYLHKEVKAGVLYKETFTKEQLLKVKLLSDSNEDTEMLIEYSSWEGSTIGLRLEHVNKQSLLDIDVFTGDYKDSAYINYEVVTTRPKDIVQRNNDVILPSTVVILDENGAEVSRDNGDGKFTCLGGDNVGGYIDYRDGVISPPPALYDREDYTIIYKQDEYSNIDLGDGDVIRLMEFPEEIDDPTNFSSIELV